MSQKAVNQNESAEATNNDASELEYTLVVDVSDVIDFDEDNDLSPYAVGVELLRYLDSTHHGKVTGIGTTPDKELAEITFTLTALGKKHFDAITDFIISIAPEDASVELPIIIQEFNLHGDISCCCSQVVNLETKECKVVIEPCSSIIEGFKDEKGILPKYARMPLAFFLLTDFTDFETNLNSDDWLADAIVEIHTELLKEKGVEYTEGYFYYAFSLENISSLANAIYCVCESAYYDARKMEMTDEQMWDYAKEEYKKVFREYVDRYENRLAIKTSYWYQQALVDYHVTEEEQSKKEFSKRLFEHTKQQLQKPTQTIHLGK